MSKRQCVCPGCKNKLPICRLYFSSKNMAFKCRNCGCYVYLDRFLSGKIFNLIVFLIFPISIFYIIIGSVVTASLLVVIPAILWLVLSWRELKQPPLYFTGQERTAFLKKKDIASLVFVLIFLLFVYFFGGITK